MDPSIVTSTSIPFVKASPTTSPSTILMAAQSSSSSSSFAPRSRSRSASSSVSASSASPSPSSSLSAVSATDRHHRRRRHEGVEGLETARNNSRRRSRGSDQRDRSPEDTHWRRREPRNTGADRGTSRSRSHSPRGGGRVRRTRRTGDEGDKTASGLPRRPPPHEWVDRNNQNQAQADKRRGAEESPQNEQREDRDNERSKGPDGGQFRTGQLRPPIPPTRHLRIAGLRRPTSRDELHDIFQKFGPVESIHYKFNNDVAYVNMQTLEDAVKARDALHRNTFEGVFYQSVERYEFAKAKRETFRATVAASRPVAAAVPAETVALFGARIGGGSISLGSGMGGGGGGIADSFLDTAMCTPHPSTKRVLSLRPPQQPSLGLSSVPSSSMPCDSFTADFPSAAGSSSALITNTVVDSDDLPAHGGLIAAGPIERRTLRLARPGPLVPSTVVDSDALPPPSIPSATTAYFSNRRPSPITGALGTQPSQDAAPRLLLATQLNPSRTLLPVPLQQQPVQQQQRAARNPPTEPMAMGGSFVEDEDGIQRDPRFVQALEIKRARKREQRELLEQQPQPQLAQFQQQQPMFLPSPNLPTTSRVAQPNHHPHYPSQSRHNQHRHHRGRHRSPSRSPTPPRDEEYYSSASASSGFSGSQSYFSSSGSYSSYSSRSDRSVSRSPSEGRHRHRSGHAHLEVQGSKNVPQGGRTLSGSSINKMVAEDNLDDDEELLSVSSASFSEPEPGAGVEGVEEETPGLGLHVHDAHDNELTQSGNDVGEEEEDDDDIAEDLALSMKLMHQQGPVDVEASPVEEEAFSEKVEAPPSNVNGPTTTVVQSAATTACALAALVEKRNLLLEKAKKANLQIAAVLGVPPPPLVVAAVTDPPTCATSVETTVTSLPALPITAIKDESKEAKFLLAEKMFKKSLVAPVVSTENELSASPTKTEQDDERAEHKVAEEEEPKPAPASGLAEEIAAAEPEEAVPPKAEKRKCHHKDRSSKKKDEHGQDGKKKSKKKHHRHHRHHSEKQAPPQNQSHEDEDQEEGPEKKRAKPEESDNEDIEKETPSVDELLGSLKTATTTPPTQNKIAGGGEKPQVASNEPTTTVETAEGRELHRQQQEQRRAELLQRRRELQKATALATTVKKELGTPANEPATTATTSLTAPKPVSQHEPSPITPTTMASPNDKISPISLPRHRYVSSSEGKGSPLIMEAQAPKPDGKKERKLQLKSRSKATQEQKASTKRRRSPSPSQQPADAAALDTSVDAVNEFFIRVPKEEVKRAKKDAESSRVLTPLDQKLQPSSSSRPKSRERSPPQHSSSSRQLTLGRGPISSATSYRAPPPPPLDRLPPPPAGPPLDRAPPRHPSPPRRGRTPPALGGGLDRRRSVMEDRRPPFPPNDGPSGRGRSPPGSGAVRTEYVYERRASDGGGDARRVVQDEEPRTREPRRWSPPPPPPSFGRRGGSPPPVSFRDQRERPPMMPMRMDRERFGSDSRRPPSPPMRPRSPPRGQFRRR